MLPSGSRLTDGITAAGGFAEEADTSFHNLAAYLQDGQKVYVPTKEEVKDLSVEDRLAHDALPKTETGIAGQTGTGTNKKVNLNTADVSELMTLSGVGQSKAESIIQYRTRVGTFSDIEELKNVTGIGDAMFERIKEYITVDG
jgi:competence protein ComEA